MRQIAEAAQKLSDDDLRQITLMLVDQLNLNLVDRQLRIRLLPDVVDWIIEMTCKDRSYGARPLRRAIQRHVEDPLSEAFIRGQVRAGRPIEIGVQDGQLWYWQEGRGGALSAA